MSNQKTRILQEAKALIKKEANEKELRLVVNLLKEKEVAEKLLKRINSQLSKYEKGQLDVEEMYDNTFYI